MSALLSLRPERLRELSLFAVMAVTIFIFSLLIDNYIGGSFFNRVNTRVAITAVLAAGQTLVIPTRDLHLSDSKTITSDGLPDWVVELPNSTIVSFGEFDIRTVVAGAIVLIVVLQLILGGLKWGRWVYAAGSNPDAARQAALPVERVILGAFVASGALAGLAGFLFLSRFGTITVNAGNGLELQSVAAAVVGGVNIFGGAGTLVGALLGAVLINLLDLSLLRVPGLSEFWRDAVLGTLILTAVAVDFLLGKRIGRITSRARGRPTAGVPDA